MTQKLDTKARRFSHPRVLDLTAPFLGATVGAWDKAFTGNMEISLAEVKRRVMDDSAKRDVANATTSDLASYVGKRLADGN